MDYPELWFCNICGFSQFSDGTINAINLFSLDSSEIV